jgi:hypothetical protein
VGRVVYAALLSSGVNMPDSVRDKLKEDRPFPWDYVCHLVFVPFMG